MKTKTELNKAVVALADRFKEHTYPKGGRPWKECGGMEAWEKENEAIKEELCSLYDEDRQVEYFNLKSVLILLTVNHTVRAIPPHRIFCDCGVAAGVVRPKINHTQKA